MLSLGFKLLVINCVYGWSPLNAQITNTSSIQVTEDDVPVSTSSFPSTNIYFENPLCTRAFPDTGHCPPFPEDMFGVLHNYTNPRPITVQEIEEVRDSCTSRLAWCCAESWSIYRDGEDVFTQLLEFSACFCYHNEVCTAYNMTRNHRLFKHHMQKYYPILHKSRLIESVKLYWRRHPPFKISLSVLYIFVWIWGLTGNILVLITTFRFMNHENATNLFIANLSFGDILVIGFALPFSGFNRIVDIWLWEDWLCKIVWWIYYASLMVSSFTMTAMAIERYIVICHPVKAQYISTPGRAKKIIATIWIAAILLSCVIVPFISGDLLKQEDCRLVFTVNLFLNDIRPIDVSIIILYYILVVAFIVPLIIMIVAYVKVGICLHQSVKEAKAMRGDINSCHQDQEKLKSDQLSSRIKVVKMLIIVMVTFVVTWIPSMLFMIVRYHHIVLYFIIIGETIIQIGDLVAMLTLLTFMNSCLNPVFYVLYSKSFRKGFSKCFTCCQKKKKRSSIQM